MRVGIVGSGKAGATAASYDIFCALAGIVDAVLHDQRSVLIVCAPIPDAHGVLEVAVSPRLEPVMNLKSSWDPLYRYEHSHPAVPQRRPAT